MNRNRHGFTLVEMLAVIFIISILAGILLPVLNHARIRAKITACQGQMVQFSRGIDIYKVNWDQEYPSFLSNLAPVNPANVTSSKNYVCPLDWTAGKDGGVPKKVKNTSVPFMPSQQYDETDDTEFNTLTDAKGDPYQSYRNQQVTRCSYLYEFCAAVCGWDWNNPKRSWGEVKQDQMKNGAKNDSNVVKYAGGHVPIVRCFWHAKQVKDGSGYINDKPVLNIGVTDRAIFNSSPKWENDLR